MRTIKNIFNKKTLIITTALIGFCCCVYFLLGFCANHFLTAQKIENITKQQTGLDLNIEGPKISTTLGLSLAISAKNISIDASDKRLFSANNIKFRVKLLPLIFKNLSIPYIEAQNININLHRDKNGKFNFEKYITQDKSFPLKLNFDKTLLKIKQSKVLFKDDKYLKTAAVESENFYANIAERKKNIKFNTETKLSICEQSGNFCTTSNIEAKAVLKLPINKYIDSKDTDIDILIKNISLKPYLPYINEFSNIKFNNIEGIADLTILKTKEKPQNEFLIKANTKDLFGDFLYNNKKSGWSLTNPAQLELKLVANNNFIEVLPSTFQSKDINTSFSGKLKNYKTNKIKPDINLKINDSDFMSLINLIPAGIVVYKTDVINELKAAKPYARLDGLLNISGNYKKPDINGEAFIRDIYLFERPKNFKTANVKCNFVKDRVNVDVHVPAPNNQFVDVKGYSELYGKQAGDYDVISSDAVDLAYAHKYLIPVQRVIGFKLGPLPFMKISGKGKIHIRATGTIYDAIVNGKFFGTGINASLNGLNAELKEGKIELDFNNKVINIKDTSAKMYDGEFALKGYADDYNNIDIETKINNISAQNALNMVKTSELIKPFSGDISFVKSANGKINITILFKGKAKSLEGLGFLDDITPNADIKLNSINAIIAPNYSFNNVIGNIAYAEDYKIDLSGDYKGARGNIKANITPSNKNLSAKDTKLKFDLQTNLKSVQFSNLVQDAKKQNYFNNKDLKFILQNTPISALDFIFDTNINAKGEISSDYKNADLSKITLNGNFTPKNTDRSKNVRFKKGKYIIKNSNIIISDSLIGFFDTNIQSSGTVSNILEKPNANLKLKATSIKLSDIEKFKNYLSAKTQKSLFEEFGKFDGEMNLDLNIKNNTPYGKVTFNDISLMNLKQQIPLVLKSGSIKLFGQKIHLDALNLTYGNTPVYIDSTIKNYLSKNPDFNTMFSTNIDEIAADRIINPYLTYPIKIKGEIRLKGRIKGDFNNYSIISYLTLPKETDITYMGANAGDTEYEREFEIKSDFTKNVAKINSAKYIKYIYSQNNKPTPLTMLKAGGKVVSQNKNLKFENFHIYTPNPVTAKIFNVIFKKSILKQGLFTCNLHLNGNVFMPAATGKINFQNINMPFYNTKINDMDFDVEKNIIKAKMNGKSFDSDIEINANIKNKQTFPIVVENLDIKSRKTSLSQLFEGISQLPKGSSDIVPGQPIVFKPQDLVILKGSAKAQDVELYDIKAQNLAMIFSNPTGYMFNIDNVNFDIAEGKVASRGNFDIVSMVFDIDSIVENCDANALSKDFLGLENQIYGRMNAKIHLKGKIPQSAQDIKLVTGRVDFSVNNGKMPKLGSLEYLLRAGNLIKSGILGLTLNNLIEVLTPYKTGEFSTIRGSFDVENGKISALEIFSKGTNLSLFIYGGYDIINDNADIEILGRLSKKVSNVLGAAGNASLNSLISTLTGNKLKDGTKSQIVDNVNKIPLIEISADDYRLFLAKIKGELNSDKYVKSFNWLN